VKTRRLLARPSSADATESDPFGITGRGRPRQSAAGHVAGLSLLVCSVGLVVAAIVDLTAGADSALVLATWALFVGSVGAVLRRGFCIPDRVRADTALSAVLAGSLAMIAVSTGAYLLTGTFDRLDDALFESVSGVSTTALTVLDDPATVDRGVLFWRALTQWIGGFSALVVIIAVLPFLGVGGPQGADARTPAGAARLLSPHVRRVVHRYFWLYLALSGAGFLLFLVGGMEWFDAVTYALTTLSTGGFANHDGSFAYFDSALIEWMGVGGMALAGVSIAFLWRLLRDRSGSLLQSTELRAYVGLLVVASAVMVWWTAPPGGPTHDSVRHAVFSVVSAASTTGHTVTDWGAWSSGAQVVLVSLMGLGAMAGSLGGGFRELRGLALISYIDRELERQIQPRIVRPVRVGRVAIDEELVGRMVGYQVLYLITAGLGAFLLALFGQDLLSSLSGSISAIATVGPALGDLSPGDGALGLSRPARAALMVVMLAGRLEIYPVLSALESVQVRLTAGTRRATARLRWRRKHG
jgi:trk system potassium uptake protein TrkH